MSFEDGIRNFKAADYEQAIHDFVAVTEQDQYNHKAWNALGICLSKIGQYENADTCFENALAISPDNVIYQKNYQRNDGKRSPLEPDLEFVYEPKIVKKPVDSSRIKNIQDTNIHKQDNNILNSIFSNKVCAVLAGILAILFFSIGIFLSNNVFSAILYLLVFGGASKYLWDLDKSNKKAPLSVNIKKDEDIISQIIVINKGLLINPHNLFKSIEHNSWKDGLKIFFILCVFNSILLGITTAYISSYNEILPLIITSFIGLILYASFYVFVLYVCIRKMGGKQGINNSMNIVIYSMIPFLLICWIPMITGFFGLIIAYLLYCGIKALEGFSTFKVVIIEFILVVSSLFYYFGLSAILTFIGIE